MSHSFPFESLAQLYGEEDAALCESALRRLVSPQQRAHQAEANPGSVWLLAYPTHVQDTDLSGIRALDALLEYAEVGFQHLHLLPPYVSAGDFGFAPIDHFEFDPASGTWEDIRRLSGRLEISLDLILNHVAPSHPWAEAAFAHDPGADTDLFIRADPEADYGALARSRHHPPVSAYRSSTGTRHYWTRYGRDQIDLDYRNPQTLIRMVGVLVEYASRGLRGLRLDALAFLWKDLSRSSANEPEVFHLLEVFRWVADRVGISILVAEGDVRGGHSPYVTPDGRRATIAYRYESAPVLLASLLRASSVPIMDWIRDHGPELHRTPALNFLSTHDGVYLRPHESPVSKQSLDILRDATRRGGGTVIERMVDGRVVPYELDISVIDLLDAAGDGAMRLAAGITLICWLPGTPMVYLGHLLGIRNDEALVRASGDERARGRGRLALSEAVARLREGIGARVLAALREFRKAALLNDAFDPSSPIISGPEFGAEVVSVIRKGRNSSALCLLSLGVPKVVVIPPEYRRDGREFIELVPWRGVVLHEIESEGKIR